MRSSRRRSTIVVVIALAIAAIAYGVVGRTSAPVGTGTDLTLRVVNTSAGKMAVTGGKVTVYVYLPDKTKPPLSLCTGDCVNDWPPVLVRGKSPRVSGIKASRVGVLVRPDGSRQVTLNGYPLYRYAADFRPGDLRGESVGSTWFAVDPSGDFLPLPPGGFTPEATSPLPIRLGATSLGDVVVTGDGQTLYTYKDDTPTSSACTPAWCVQDWPPLVVSQNPGAIEGVSGPVGILRRNDGALQLTLAGHPLYRFSGDQRPGDTRGTGIGGDWYPVRADGSPARA